MKAEGIHTPVLLNEVINYLHVEKNKKYIDATVDGGALAQAILERNAPHGMLLGFEWDQSLFEAARKRLSKFQERCVIVHSNYADMKTVVAEKKFGPVSGIVFDLGVSTYHFEESGRGFSFQKDEALDMRFNPHEQFETAGDIVNTYGYEDIEKIISEYGEEQNAKIIAQEIVSERKHRPIVTTHQLVRIIERSYKGVRGKIHSATKTFQALRIAVNREFENIKTALPDALEILEPEGYLAVISFHSLEDKIVKTFFNQKKSTHNIITKKPITPNIEEIRNNPKARSAKLRILQKIK